MTADTVERVSPGTMIVRPSLDVTAYEPRNLNEAVMMAKVLAKSGLLGRGLDPNPETVLFLMARGRELGFSTVQSIAAFHIMDGVPSLSARAQVALCQRRRDVCEYLMCVETTPTQATWETKRIGHPTPSSFTYTIEDARLMGLLEPGRARSDGTPAGPTAWMKQPSTMLRWRSATALIAMVYSDLTLGLYDPEEYRETARSQGREVIDGTFAPVTATVLDAAVEETAKAFGDEPTPPPDEGDDALAALADKPPEVAGVDRPFREGDACPWCAKLQPPIASKYAVAKGGKNKGELQCRGQRNGTYFNHPADVVRTRTAPPANTPAPAAAVVVDAVLAVGRTVTDDPRPRDEGEPPPWEGGASG